MTMTREWIFRVFICLVGFGALFFVDQRGQDLNADLFNYHFFSGYALLHGRFAIDVAPSGVGTFMNPIASAFSYAAISLLAFPFSAWLIVLLQWLSLPILLMIAREIRFDLGLHKPGLEEFLALALCLLAPLWWSELGTSFFSSTTAPLILLAVLLGIRAVKKSRVGEATTDVLFFAGAAAGLASGLKLTNAIFAIALFVALVPTIGKAKLDAAAKALVALAVGIAAGFALTAAWNVYLAAHWGSPMFPFYNTIFHSPYWDQTNFRDERWVFHSMEEFAQFLGQAATKGTVKTLEIEFGDARLAIYLALAVAGAVASAIRFCLSSNTAQARMGFHASRFLLIFVAVAMFLWAAVFAYERYLIPVELLLGLAIWILCVRLLKDRIAVFAALITCVGIGAVVMEVPDWGHTPASPDAPNIFGLNLPVELKQSPAEYLIIGNFNSFALVYFDPRSNFLRGDFSGYAEGRVKRAFEESKRPKRIFSNDDPASINNAIGTAKRLGYRLAGETRDCLHFTSKRDKYLVCDLKPIS